MDAGGAHREGASASATARRQEGGVRVMEYATPEGWMTDPKVAEPWLQWAADIHIKAQVREAVIAMSFRLASMAVL